MTVMTLRCNPGTKIDVYTTCYHPWDGYEYFIEVRYFNWFKLANKELYVSSSNSNERVNIELTTTNY